MRRAPLLFLGFLAVAVCSAAAVSACSESFPQATTDDGGPPDAGQLEGTPPDVVAPALRVNASSAPVAFDPISGGVWTANGDVGTISFVDPAARKLVQEIHVGHDVRSIAISPDGAWVAAVDRSGSSVTFVDARTRLVRATLPVGAHPRACVWDSANPRWLYVVEEDAGVVDVIDRTVPSVVEAIPVGRIPSGVSVSATRRELYVSHRIDPDLTIVDLHDRSVAADVLLADEPFSDPKTPNGKPLGFETVAVTADGQRAWTPHELLASTHPFVFDETLFPSISVFDLAARIEQQTDPNSPDGTIAGRKNLFDAIDIQDTDGQPAIFSQFCAVAMHPSGDEAWALACGSEDLLWFDVDHGTAIDAIRNLHQWNCDHPAGMTLDDKGDRIFVVCDQSKTLLTFDTAHGDPTRSTTELGAAIPIAKDTVDMQLRAGLTFFFSANPNKGMLRTEGPARGTPVPTTGNGWMSCAGCHLDGFVSTNQRLFEALLPPANPALDAEIGHIGLNDNFSTAVYDSRSAAFDVNAAHDVLVALRDQGGLADLRGTTSASIDPSNPPSGDVSIDVTMAKGLATVIARDLPAQPTWLLNAGGAPNTSYDGEWCGQCHAQEYSAWSQSVHAHAAQDPMMLYCVGRERQIVGGDAGVDAGPGFHYTQLCAGCHDPVAARGGNFTLQSDAGPGSGRGVTCLGCHDVTREIRAGGNGDLQATTHDWTQDHAAWAKASLATLTQPEFCGGCHSQFVPGSGLMAIGTLSEYHASPYAPSTRCVDCHMPQMGQSGVFDHRFPGGNVYLSKTFDQPDADLTAAQLQNLTHVVTLAAQRIEGGVLVTIANGGAGHSFPTGVTDIREPWVEVQALDANGNMVGEYGGPGPSAAALPPGAARLGTDIAQADGGILLQHELSAATRIPYDVRVPSGASQTLFVTLPAALPPTAAQLDAVLYYRNVRTTYFRDATGKDAGAAPTTEMARVKVP
ncbi:MAG TPA: multiheme c-type cytochrome [Polyangiaceae bacterium]